MYTDVDYKYTCIHELYVTKYTHTSVHRKNEMTTEIYTKMLTMIFFLWIAT